VAHHCIVYDKLSPNQKLTTTNTSTTSRGRITWQSIIADVMQRCHTKYT